LHIEPGKPYGLPPELRAAIDAVSADLETRASIDEAIARKAGDHDLAVEASREADAALAEIEVALALETDDGAAKNLEAAAETARKRQFEAVIQLQRVGRVTQALVAKAIEADERLKHDRQLLQMEAGAKAQIVLDRLAGELREAAKPVLAVLRKAYATSAAFGIGGAMVQLLDAIQIPSLIANEQPLINGFRATDEGGNMINLQSAWRDDPTAASIATALQPLSDIRRRVGSHTDYKAAQSAPTKYVSRSNSSDTIERAHRTELKNEERRVAAEAARPLVPPQPSRVLGIGARN
jgi:hypothetical protein